MREKVSGAGWQAFLDRHGLADRDWSIARLPGITNDTWLLTDPADDDRHGRSYVLRRYRRTTSEDALTFELAAVQYLAEQGFPVAAVVEAGDGARFDTPCDPVARATWSCRRP